MHVQNFIVSRQAVLNCQKFVFKPIEITAAEYVGRWALFMILFRLWRYISCLLSWLTIPATYLQSAWQSQIAKGDNTYTSE